jgi:hypothetical protein
LNEKKEWLTLNLYEILGAKINKPPMHTNQMNFWGFQHVKGAFDHNALVWEVVKNNLCKRNNLNLLYQNTMSTFRFVKTNMGTSKHTTNSDTITL